MANDSDMSGWSDLLHSSSKLLEQAAPSAQFPPLQRNLDQLESLSKKLKAKTLRTEAPSQSIAATRLLAREGINAEQLARDLKSFELKRGYTSPLKDSTSPNHSILPSSEPFIEANLPEKGFEDQATSIAQPVGESSSFQGVSPPNVESDEGPIDLSVGQEPIRSDKDESSQAVKSSSGIIPPPFSKTTNESVHEDTYTMLRSIQDLFTSWEQVKASQTARSSSASRPSTASAVFSIENMNILKQAVLEYTSFMDMDISNASAASQQDKFERLSHQMAQALELPSLKLSTDLKLSLKIIHQEISVLLARNVQLKAKKTQYVNAVIEKESLHQEINQAKNNLNEISSDVMVEDYLMMSLAAQMKEIQGKMDDCKARLAAKKRNASQKVERARFLFERYSSLEVDEGIMDELSTASVQQRDEWEKLREHMCSIWGKL